MRLLPRMKAMVILAVGGIVASLAASSSMAVDQQQDRLRIHQDDSSPLQTRDRDREQIFCQYLMSPAEIETYRYQYNILETEQERFRFRQRHEEKMQQRARSMGVTIPPSEYQARSEHYATPPDRKPRNATKGSKGGGKIGGNK